MELSNRKLLILGGNDTHIKVVNAARQLGVYTIVTDYLETSPAKEIADEKILIDIFDVDGIVAFCRERKIDGVLNFCNDHAQIPYQRVCELLDCPCFGDERQYKILTDKNEFKLFCRECGVGVIPDYTIDDINANNVKYPVIVKPSESCGSRGQTICYNKEELLSSVRKAQDASRNNFVLIEKYMAGYPDTGIHYIVVNGEPYIEKAVDRVLGMEKDGLHKQCAIAKTPSNYSDIYTRYNDDTVKKMIRKLGIVNGPIFLQGFIDGNTYRFYDPGLRFPGSEYEEILKNETGVDWVKQSIVFALCGSFSIAPDLIQDGYMLNGKHAAQVFVQAMPGIIAEIIGLERIGADPNCLYVICKHSVGDRICASGDVKQRICEFAFVENTRDELRAKIRWAYSVMSIRDTNGDSILCELTEDQIRQI